MYRKDLLKEMSYYLERLHSMKGDLLYTYEGTCDMMLELLEELDVLKEYDE